MFRFSLIIKGKWSECEDSFHKPPTPKDRTHSPRGSDHSRAGRLRCPETPVALGWSSQHPPHSISLPVIILLSTASSLRMSGFTPHILLHFSAGPSVLSCSQMPAAVTELSPVFQGSRGQRLPPFSPSLGELGFIAALSPSRPPVPPTNWTSTGAAHLRTPLRHGVPTPLPAC